MYKLIIIADPMQEVEIYEVTKDEKTHKISQLRLPQESVEFVKNYSNSVQEEVDVTYIGPDDYIRYFVHQVDKFEFVKAHMNQSEE